MAEEEHPVVRLMVYTDEPLHSIALELLLRQCDDVSLEAVVSDGRKLVEQVGLHRPDVILLTVYEGGDWGLLNTLRRDFPETRIVLWVHDMIAESAYQAMERGVRGILSKKLPPEMIVQCVRRVSEGATWFDNVLAQTLLNGRRISVSRRQGQLITLVSQGLKNKEIASIMSITEGTVKVYLSRLFEKMGVKDRFELALLGLRNAQSSFAAAAGETSAPLLTSMFVQSGRPAEPAATKAHRQPGVLFREGPVIQ
jgi:DNA-binding NarL/FixJ family response regulator